MTGGMHIDGLMDTFDGIYAGKKKMITAMKDSRVGSFGVQSLFVITLLQFASLLEIRNQIFLALPISLLWGRFSTLIYIDKYEYINESSKSISHKETWRGFLKESLLSIVIIFGYYFFAVIFFTDIGANCILLLSGALICLTVPNYLGKRVGGFNGDTCGANTLIVETLMLFIHAIVL